MGWVVKSWSVERLAELADAVAREAARQTVLDAEREARVLGRGAAREVADAIAYLEVLEQLGVQTRLAVERQRGLVRAEPAPGPEPAAEAAPVGPAPTRRRRATLHDSPLTELFRATAAA
ncbi:MAG: hypothetical protein QOF84_431 [Streptomyces sp.]|jgi:hypothetical protein|nr:hypothetical protein [Streptomyces sp.]MEA2276270.1 hypothetical protein [Solirubrobacteraceae bacterium]